MGGEILTREVSIEGNEQLIGYLLPRSVKVGFLSYKQYYIFETNKRLIFNRYTKAMAKAHEKSLDEKVKGQGFKDRLKMIASHKVTLPEEYLAMGFEELMALHEENFSLNHDEINSVKRRHRTNSSKNNGSSTHEYLKLNATKKKYTITPGYYDDMILLNLVLGDKAKPKKITFGL